MRSCTYRWMRTNRNGEKKYYALMVDGGCTTTSMMILIWVETRRQSVSNKTNRIEFGANQQGDDPNDAVRGVAISETVELLHIESVRSVRVDFSLLLFLWFTQLACVVFFLLASLPLPTSCALNRIFFFFVFVMTMEMVERRTNEKEMCVHFQRLWHIIWPDWFVRVDMLPINFDICLLSRNENVSHGSIVRHIHVMMCR